MRRSTSEYLDRRQHTDRLGWLLSTASFILFLGLQVAVLGSYFHWISKVIK
jgi:hypothetical protein